MKKTALLLVIVLLLSLSLSSCDVITRFIGSIGTDKLGEEVSKPQNADELYRLVDNKMSSLKSYRGDVTADVKFTYLGKRIKGEMTMTMVAIGSQLDDNPYLYVSGVTRTYMDDSLMELEDVLTVYEDGNAYLGKEINDEYSFIYSELEVDEFFDYYLNDAVEFDFSKDDAGTQSMKELGHGNWELKYSDYKKEAFEEMRDDLGLGVFDEDLGLKMNGMSIEIIADSEYRISEMTVKFTSEGYDDPVITMSIKYSEYDSAERVDFDKTKYEQVDDVRIAKWVEDYLEEIINEEEVTFTLYTKQVVSIDKISQGTSKSEYCETDRITYRNNGKGFGYSIEAEMYGQEVSIEFANGIQTISAAGQTEEVSQSLSEARSFIKSLIDPADYEAIRVTDIKRTGKNQYRIDLVTFDTTEFVELMRNMRVSYSGSEVYIIVYMDGEDVKSMRTFITVNGRNLGVSSSGSVSSATYSVECNVVIISD